MAIEILSAEDVLSSSSKNKERSYPAKSRDAHRLLPFAQVAHSPKFKFSRDAKIFTAGSCFARNVERSLIRSGYSITSSNADFYNPFPERVPFQRFNKYTIASILNEIEWALGEKPMPSEDLLCEVTPGAYCDLQTSGEGLRTSLDEMVKFRETYNACFAPVKDADVVIITLGLVECWHDNNTGVFLNCFPGPKSIMKNPGRFSLHVLDYNDIYQGLVATYETIARHNPDFRMLVTVSPVPLDRTFRGSDILVANAYSKAVQRAAVEAFVAAYPADYFPSYETVTLTDTKYAWSDQDFRHVRTEIVDRLMGSVLEQYTEVTEQQSAQKTNGYVTSYLQAGDQEGAKAALAKHTDLFPLSVSLMYPAADLAFRDGRAAESAEILRDLIARIDADHAAANELLDGRTSQTRNSAGALLAQCQHFIDQPEAADSADMEHARALSIIESQLGAQSDSADLYWLKEYFERAANNKADTRENRESQTFLQEVSAVSKFRTAARGGDIAKAEQIAKDATKALGFSEIIQWELAILYRDHDRQNEAFEIFQKIGRFGGTKAVPAVRNAFRLATKLGRDAEIADLADHVAQDLK